jgi:hypothetical protein
VRSSFYRVFKTGNAHARIILAVSQITNINPHYYTGETDERETLTVEQVRKFLADKGGEGLLAALDEETPKPKRKYNRKPKAETPYEAAEAKSSDASLVTAEITVDSELVAVEDDEDDTNIENVLEITLMFSDEPKMKTAVEELTEQEAMELLHTLFIRAKGGSQAEFLADVVKRCLLK